MTSAVFRSAVFRPGLVWAKLILGPVTYDLGDMLLDLQNYKRSTSYVKCRLLFPNARYYTIVVTELYVCPVIVYFPHTVTHFIGWLGRRYFRD